MKKVLAIVIAALMVAAMTTLALAAPETPPELSTAFVIGEWGVATTESDGTHDPALDGQGVPAGAFVYGLFDAGYAPIDPPASVTGYEKVTSMTDLAAGKWFLLEGSSGFNYVILIEGVAEPEPTEEPEPEEPEDVEVTPDIQEPETLPAPVDPAPEAPPAEEAPAPAEEAPAPEAPAAPSDTTVSFDGLPKMTATGLQSKWYKFDLSAFGTPGFVYALYFDDGGTVSFDAAVQLVSIDATTFAPTTTDVAAGAVLNVSDINGQSIAIGTTGNSVCFVQASNPGNYTGLVADQPLSALPASVSGGGSPATGDTSGIVLFSAMFVAAAAGLAVLALPRRGKSRNK